MTKVMDGMVQTVLGKLEPHELGSTTTHEHLLIDFTCMFNEPSEASDKFRANQPVTIDNLGWVRYDPFRNKDNLELLDEETAVSEVMLFKRAGGMTVVDATTIGIGRDPKGLVRIARATGINIVMGSGYYVDAVHPKNFSDRTDQDLSEQFIKELTEGVENTGIKAGIVGELGCSWPLTENERKVLRAGAMAQQHTGAAILIHPGRNDKAPFEILDVLLESGADVGRIIMGHIDRTIHDIDILLEFAKRGCYLEYDLFGWETSNYPLSPLDMLSDAQRVDYVKRLIDEGYGDRIVLAQDIFGKHALVRYGGYGYGHILTNIVPRMRGKGILDDQIHAMIVGNPANVLPFAKT